ncbi:MAG: 50S ribosomal protein L19e [Euryarchaeota archaeon]|nr:50S ribosomal protein L19e [Euryarchaeota archaeon]
MDLKNQKRMAADILGCGFSRVWIDPNRIDDVADAITRADIRKAIDSGSIRAKPEKGVSRGRARYKLAQRAKGRRRGQGSRKGAAGARTPTKKRWIQTIRPIRATLRELKEEGKISRSTYRLFYRKAKGGMFRSKRQLLLHLRTQGHLKEEI